MSEKRTGKRITYRGKTKVCEFYKDKPWKKPLTKDMETFERETGKKAVFRGVVTGSYEHWKYWKDEFPVRKRRTKTEVTTSKKKEKKVEYEVYVKYRIDQLEAITNKYQNKLPPIARRQIQTHIRKYRMATNPNRGQIYKLEIIKIFEMHNIPFNKKMISKRRVLIDA